LAAEVNPIQASLESPKNVGLNERDAVMSFARPGFFPG